MSDWIKWCKCNGSILTTEQMRKGLPCQRCQEEHARTLKERLAKLQKEDEDGTSTT